MCVQPVPWPEPDPLIAAAIAAKYSGKRPRPLAVLIRDRLGEWLGDEDFAAAFGIRGRPGWSPSRLALVTMLQRAENLTDRQAAEAVRTRIDWQYLLGLPVDDPGFDHTVLAEFRGRVAGAGLEQVVLDALLARLASEGLVKAGGKQRTDSTRVVAAVAALTRLQLAGESVRAVLEALAAAHPAWLEQRVCVSDFARRYGTPMTSWRPPLSPPEQDELAIAYARDGYALLEAVYDNAAPAWLRELPAIGVLRRVLLQNYTRTITEDGREVIRRREKQPEGDGLPPGHARIASPYDTDARWAARRDSSSSWLGYKLHITETCDDPPPCTCRPAGDGARDREHGRGCAHLVFPNLITNVATTGATVTDHQMTEPVQDALAARNLAPRSALRRLGLCQRRPGGLGAGQVGHRPDRAAAGRHLRPGPRRHRVRPRRLHRRLRHQDRHLPAGQTSSSWTACTQKDHAAAVATFSPGDCGPCPARPQCTTSSRNRRQITILPRDLAQAQAAARAAEKTIPFQAGYARRAGVEGAMHQAISHGARRARYRGLPKTRLDHVYMACALNLLRSRHSGPAHH